MKEELLNVETIVENGEKKVVLTTEITTANGLIMQDKSKISLPKFYEMLTVGLKWYLKRP